MWDLIESVPDHCLSFYFDGIGSVFPIKILRAFIKRIVFRSNGPLHEKTCLRLCYSIRFKISCSAGDSVWVLKVWIQQVSVAAFN